MVSLMDQVFFLEKKIFFLIYFTELFPLFWSPERRKWLPPCCQVCFFYSLLLFRVDRIEMTIGRPFTGPTSRANEIVLVFFFFLSLSLSLSLSMNFNEEMNKNRAAREAKEFFFFSRVVPFFFSFFFFFFFHFLLSFFFFAYWMPTT